MCAAFAGLTVAVDEPSSGCTRLQMTLELPERLPILIQVRRSKIHVFPLQKQNPASCVSKAARFQEGLMGSSSTRFR